MGKGRSGQTGMGHEPLPGHRVSGEQCGTTRSGTRGSLILRSRVPLCLARLVLPVLLFRDILQSC